MNPEITESEGTPSANAVSIFGQGGSPSDFPVLKAFQEYIDAEQAKARKRMLGLSVFFILLLVVVIVTFTVVVMSVINRNQSLSDRLLDIALREKIPAQPVVNVQSPAPAPVVQPVVHQQAQEDTLKPVLEKFDKLAEALIKTQQQPLPVAQPAPVVVTTSPQPVVQTAAESAELIRLREELRREREERKAEKEAREKEEKRQAEVEAHRRRLYPEYYAQQEARKVAAETERRAPPPLPGPVQQPVPPAPVVKPKPAAAPAIPPSPSTQPAPEGNKAGKLKPRSYLGGSIPSEDPELNELFKKGSPASSSARQPKQQEQPAPMLAPKQQEQPAPKLAPKQQEQPAPKPAPKQQVAQPAPQPIAKPVAKPTPKLAVQPPSKPALNPPAPPTRTQAVQVPAQQENKIETLSIGGADGSSIPWLIEIPQN